MFEKEAEEIVKRNVCGDCNKCQSHGYIGCEVYRYSRDSYLRGVNDGCNKANEWHYMKDVRCYEDLPQNKDVYYAYVVNVGEYDKPTIERRLGCFAEFEYDVMAYHVIAWKEIVLPEFPKEIKENE